MYVQVMETYTKVNCHNVSECWDEHDAHFCKCAQFYVSVQITLSSYFGT